MWLRLVNFVYSNLIYVYIYKDYINSVFFFLQKTIRDKEYKSSQMKLGRLEKLFRALQMERNELNEKVEVLKEQVSVKEADVDLATAMIKPCSTVAFQKELNTSSKRAPGIYLQDETKAANKTKCLSKDPSHMVSSGH